MVPRLCLLVVACGALVACAPRQTFLVNGATSSPILEIMAPASSGQCESQELRLVAGRDGILSIESCSDGRCVETDPTRLTYRDRASRVDSGAIQLAVGSTSQGPVEPVVGPDGLLWLCREDEEEQCICIPWFPEE